MLIIFTDCIPMNYEPLKHMFYLISVSLNTFIDGSIIFFLIEQINNMDYLQYQKLFETINQNSELYRDELRLGGVLYKHGYPGIDILPCSLTPYVINSRDYQLLIKAQPLWQKLLYLTSQDNQFVNQTFKVTAEYDPFVRQYLKIYNQTYHYKQEIQFVIIRNDYLKDGVTKKWGLVEFNTLAVANGAMTQKLQNVIYRLYHEGTLKNAKLKPQIQFPKSLGYQKTFGLMYEAFQLYGNPEAIVLIIGEVGEKNIYDHRYVGDYFEEKGTSFVMLSLDQAVDRVKCQNQKVYYEQKQVAILYFRAGSSLKEYREETWNFKKNIQLTRAIKIPTVDLQLINFKRAQLELCKHEVMSKYLIPQQVQILMQVITPGIHMENIQDFADFLSTLDYDSYVLKPNKQGGGNNIYGQQIISTLKMVGPEGAKAYVLMNKIPTHSQTSIQCKLKSVDLIESTTQFGQIGGILIQKGEIMKQAVGGILVRTKPSSANEGGIAKGYGGIDTLVIDHSQE